MLALIIFLQLVIAGVIILGFRINLDLGYIMTALAVLVAFLTLRSLIPLMIFQFAIIYFAMKVGKNLSKTIKN